MSCAYAEPVDPELRETTTMRWFRATQKVGKLIGPVEEYEVLVARFWELQAACEALDILEERGVTETRWSEGRHAQHERLRQTWQELGVHDGWEEIADLRAGL